MDVERIQKINNLALDLMRQGLATTRDEAISMAEKTFQEKSEDYNSLRETMQEVKKEAEPQAKPEMDLSQEQIKDILEQNSKFLVRKIQEFQGKVDSIEREMADLRTKMNYQKLPTVNDIVSKKKEPEAQEAAKEETKDHPRSGNYEENDVSIEKFFYMGK